jgi:hypothetical protein
MPIDIDREVESGFLYRYMSVKQLKDILNTLPDEAIVIPNRVGNLTVEHNEQPIGYIDFNGEGFVTI